MKDAYRTEQTIGLIEANYGTKEDLFMQKLRKDYISKVLNIVAAQLITTSLFTFAAIQVPWIRRIVLQRWVVVFSSILTIVPMLCLSCGMSQKTPMNYILLAVFTLCMSVTTASSVMIYLRRYGLGIIVSALVATASLVTVLSIYAKTTKRQFGDYMTYMFAGGMAIMVTSLIGLFVKSTILQLVIAGSSILLFSFYFIFDVQRLVNSQPIDDYILGAMHIYLDVVTIFLEILRMFGLMKESSS